MEGEQSQKEKCERCHDTGIVKEPNGSCHTCFDCLSAGRLDQHSEEIPNSRFRL